MKTKFLFFIVLIFQVSFGQQNDEFRRLKGYFENQKSQIATQFEKELAVASFEKKLLMQQDYALFMHKMDSVQNVAFVGALIRTRNEEDINLISKLNSIPDSKYRSEITIPTYPGGMNALREELVRHFYLDAFSYLDKNLSTQIQFVVDELGNIIFVDAEGENGVLNRQASLAVYLLQGKFTPAKWKGKTVPYRLEIPIKLQLEE